MKTIKPIYDDSRIICPYCRYVQMRAFGGDIGEDPMEENCNECGKPFMFYAEITCVYVSKPIPELNK